MTGAARAGGEVAPGVAGERTPVSLRTVDADGTRRVARALAGLCVAGDVLLLIGDLGAGKNTFAQGFAAGLGID